ncbi:hypothetical protein [Bifidobacterium sp. SO1]|uniref:hypothetical protein n=1 Tax=Bifidobacterium sp. SO1 TaxID=2809029 RepID=UPI001BDBEE52|nr:hypothetical protein [Bifidobacterium sp. SO1]MBT1162125.1 hypothetical protein [Bifidobacterium sp. SO1]
MMGVDLKPGRLAMRQDDIDHLFLSAVGYAIGRGTYATEGVLDALDLDYRLLSPEGANRLIRFINGFERPASPARWHALTRRLADYEHDPSCVLTVNNVDRRIVFFSAFRYDITSDDPQMPKLWERWANDYPQVVYGRDHWNLLSARDLVWENLIPLNEPLKTIQNIGGRVKPADDRWVPLFRMLRDGRPDDKAEA